MAASSDLMPLRTTSWSSTSMTRSGGASIGPSLQGGPGWLKRGRHLWVVASRRISVPTFSSIGDRLIVLSDMAGDRRTDPVEEVLDGRLGHPVQQYPVHGLADGAQGWPVAGADGQLGPALAEGADLDVGLQAGEYPVQADRLPGQGERGSWRGSGPAHPAWIFDPPPEAGAERPDPDLGEQAHPRVLLGRAGHPREPLGGGGEQGVRSTWAAGRGTSTK